MYTNPSIVEVHIKQVPPDARLMDAPYSDQYGEAIDYLQKVGFKGADNLVIMYIDDYRLNRFNTPLVKPHKLQVNNRGPIGEENLEYLFKGDQFETGIGVKNFFVVGRYWLGCVKRACASICTEVINNPDQLMHINFHFVTPLIDRIPTKYGQFLHESRHIFYMQEASSFNHDVFIDGQRIDWKSEILASYPKYRFDTVEKPVNLSTINVYFWSNAEVAKSHIMAGEI